MKFVLLPVMQVMLDLYRQPPGAARFEAYIRILQGTTKDDLVLPVSGFNPMAKAPAVERLHELQQLGAEEIIGHACGDLNKQIKHEPQDRTFGVALNLADDLRGGWTNRFTADYDSKFRIGGLVNRDFCTPVFWTGEPFHPSMIRERTLTACYRALYRSRHSDPVTLRDHLEQERFAAAGSHVQIRHEEIDVSLLEIFYSAHQHSSEYPVIFNFFYGDAASASLGLPAYGISQAYAGFGFAAVTSGSDRHR